MPCDVNGDLVWMCNTPCELFGPYNADAGPSNISMRSMSSLVEVKSNGTLTRNDGTLANR